MCLSTSPCNELLISQTSKYVDLRLGIKNLYPGYKMKLITIVFDYLGAVLGASVQAKKLLKLTTKQSLKTQRKRLNLVWPCLKVMV